MGQPNIFSLPPQQFSLLATLIGLLLTAELDLDEQNSLGNFIVSVGQAMLTAAAQGALLKASDTQNEQIQQKIRELKNQIALLEKEVNDAH